MEENINRKRKLLGEQLFGMPPRKHACWDQILECDSASDSSMGPKKMKSSIFPRLIESDQESAKDSNSFWEGNTEAESSSYGCSAYHSCPKAHECNEPSSSSANWGDNNSYEIGLYSSNIRSFENPPSFSKSEDIEDFHNDYGLHLPDDYQDDHLREFESHVDHYCLECKTDDGSEHCMDLDNLHCSSDLAPTNYVHSSGRLPLDQDTQLGTRKLTIDKEFEQYFSSLML